MAKNNVKPYGSSNNRNRTLSNKKNLGVKISKKTKKQSDNSDNSLENTTRIRIDSKRINDAESLDTSFLEGRIDKKVRDNNKAKEKILKEKKQIIFDFEIIKWIFFSLAFLCIIVLAIVYFKNSPLFKIDDSSVTINEKKSKSKEKEQAEKIVLDSNYLFVGDYSINKLNFEDLDYHYVKSSSDELTSSNVLNDIDSKIYTFNPSDIFIQVGTYDLNEDKSNTEIISNYRKIINGIKKNRSYANINIISLLYINKDVDEYDSDIFNDKVSNDKIRKLNNEIKSLCNEMNVNYIEMNELYNSNDELDSKYTSNGIYLNDEGNELVIKKIKEYLE